MRMEFSDIELFTYVPALLRAGVSIGPLIEFGGGGNAANVPQRQGNAHHCRVKTMIALAAFERSIGGDGQTCEGWVAVGYSA